jgi:hypothetical protein
MKVFYNERRTINLGNYESKTVEIGVEDLVNNMSAEEALNRLKDFVTTQLEISMGNKSCDVSFSEEELKTKIKNLVTHDPEKIQNLRNKLSILKATNLKDLNKKQLFDIYNFLVEDEKKK